MHHYDEPADIRRPERSGDPVRLARVATHPLLGVHPFRARYAYAGHARQKGRHDEAAVFTGYKSKVIRAAEMQDTRNCDGVKRATAFVSTLAMAYATHELTEVPPARLHLEPLQPPA